VQGFETPFGMELLATVHWVAVHDGALTVDEAVDAVYQWKDRKRAFEPRQIRLAWDSLCGGRCPLHSLCQGSSVRRMARRPSSEIAA
jgi:hypothetical protein